MQHEILKFGVKNTNNRMYTPENTQFPSEGHVLLLTDDGLDDAEIARQVALAPGIPMEAVAGRFTNMRIEGDSLVCDVETLETPAGVKATALMKNAELTPVSSGHGEVGASGEVTNFTLSHLFYTRSPTAWMN